MGFFKNKTMKAATVGLGKMGLLHTALLNTLENVEIKAISEKEGFVKKYIQKLFPELNVYDDYIEMFDKENLDVVYITTPISSHFPIINNAIDSGINFFVEKPFVYNFEQAKILCDRLRNSNIGSAVGYNLRFSTTFQYCKNLLTSNVLGDIEFVDGSMYVSNIFSKPSGWRFRKEEGSGGVLNEFGAHLVDLIRWFFGEIEKVKGNVKSLYSLVDDAAYFKMEFENGAKGQLDTSWSKEGYRILEINVEIKGSNGRIKVNQDYVDLKLKEPVSQFDNLETRIYKQDLGTSVPFDIAGPDYTRQEINVTQSFEEGKKPLVDAFEGAMTQSVIQAVYDSSKLGKEIKVEKIEKI